MNELPWFKRGDYYVDVTDEKKPKYFKLSIGPEMLPHQTYTFVSRATESEGDWIRMDENATDLETDREDLFFQWFVGVQKAGIIYMAYPMGEQFWTTDKLIPTSTRPEVACITFKTSPYLDPSALGEFFIVKGINVGFKYRNNQAYNITQKLRFTGAKFKREIVPTPIPEIIAKARALRFARIP